MIQICLKTIWVSLETLILVLPLALPKDRRILTSLLEPVSNLQHVIACSGPNSGADSRTRKNLSRLTSRFRLKREHAN
ncbi:hypothetical protein BDP27DRAFT_1335627, partial [Rhodocollybia butyracea]